MSFKMIGAALLAAAMTLPAAAATYNFSYTAGNGIAMSALVDGTLTSDPNRLQVNAMRNLVIGGIARTVFSVCKFSDCGALGWLGLNGHDNSLAIRVGTNSFAPVVYFFTSANPSPQPGTYDRFYGDTYFNYQGEKVITANYALTAAPAVPAVPLPAGGVLLASGLGVLVLRRKRA